MLNEKLSSKRYYVMIGRLIHFCIYTEKVLLLDFTNTKIKGRTPLHRIGLFILELANSAFRSLVVWLVIFTLVFESLIGDNSYYGVGHCQRLEFVSGIEPRIDWLSFIFNKPIPIRGKIGTQYGPILHKISFTWILNWSSHIIKNIICLNIFGFNTYQTTKKTYFKQKNLSEEIRVANNVAISVFIDDF